MQEQMYFPEGGVGSFLTSNMDEMPDNVLAFGQPRGINSMGDVANRMARMGRNGDTELAHLRRDEVVMTEDMARDPRIRNAMAEVFSDNDMDMARYTVGNAANSVNPYTGNREFFIKKIIKGVKKIVKMAAPIVIPLAMNALFPGMGALASGFIGTGISSLAQGNSFKDSMKAGLMGGIMGGFQQGIGNFMNNRDLMSGMGPTKGKFFEFKNPFKPEPVEPIAVSSRQSVTATPTADKLTLVNKRQPLDDANLELAKVGTGAATEPSKLDSFTDMFRNKEGDFSPYRIGGGLLLAGAAGGGFDQIPAEEVEDPYDQESPSQRLLDENPEKYRTGVVGAPSYRSLYDVMVPTVRPPIYPPFVEPVQTAARGGEMENFPRKTGYISGPGTETSDSIPAMLSDGEFVMNAKAVRGAGGGSRERGVRKMYDMMRAFEGGAVA